MPLQSQWNWKGMLLLAFIATMALGAGAFAQRDRLGPKVMAVSHDVLGDKITWKIEGQYFAAIDKFNRVKFTLFGGKTNLDPVNKQGYVYSGPKPDENIPATSALEVKAPVVASDAQPVAKEAEIQPAIIEATQTTAPWYPPNVAGNSWDFAGLPNPPWRDPLMAKIDVAPDPARPYALVRVLAMDKRYIRLHLTGGTKDLDTIGVGGPGRIPDAHRPYLLAAWNGGFQLPHADWGMIADGKNYKALAPGYATLSVSSDWTIKMGVWGRDNFTGNGNLIAVRQNGKLLVDNCQSLDPSSADAQNWGRVKAGDTQSFVTWRSAIGLTANGDLLYAAGGNLSPTSLARALQAAGACRAMQLDINSGWVLGSLLYPQPDKTVRRSMLMEGMSEQFRQYLANGQERDFMFVTLDEGRNP